MTVSRYRHIIGCAILGWGASLNATSDAHDVRSALYCLTQGPDPLVAHTRDRRYTVIASHDDVAFAHERHVIVFIAQTGARYEAFDVAVARHRYSIRNNAALRAGPDGIRYLNDPLGGIWMHDFIAANFAVALKRRPIIVDVDRALSPRPSCRRRD